MVASPAPTCDYAGVPATSLVNDLRTSPVKKQLIALPDPHIQGIPRSGEIEMNSSMYHQIAKTTVADRLLAPDHHRTLRAAPPARPPGPPGPRRPARRARPRRRPPALRGLLATRRVRALARLRTA